MKGLKKFLQESNMIEGIKDEPTEQQLESAEKFLAIKRVKIKDMASIVSKFQNGAMLRDNPQMNVQVGTHHPPSGGQWIVDMLDDLLLRVHHDSETPYCHHHEYESLHPFTDGNGRSGRLLWLWQHLRYAYHGYHLNMGRGFLHQWYYESLQYGVYTHGFGAYMRKYAESQGGDSVEADF